MRIICHVSEPDDLLLAGRAVKAAIKGHCDTDTIIEFENGHSFFVKRNQTGWSVWRGQDQ